MRIIETGENWMHPRTHRLGPVEQQYKSNTATIAHNTHTYAGMQILFARAAAFESFAVKMENRFQCSYKSRRVSHQRNTDLRLLRWEIVMRDTIETSKFALEMGGNVIRTNVWRVCALKNVCVRNVAAISVQTMDWHISTLFSIRWSFELIFYFRFYYHVLRLWVVLFN